jgi:Zn-dependent protease
VRSPLFDLRDNPMAFFAFVIAVVVAITVHEFSHAAVATLQGDRTPRSQGRLTLNPIAHLDPLGSIALILAGFGWGKPVQFSPFQLRNRRAGAALVGLAGPASNFVLALLSALALRFALESNPSDFAITLLFTLVSLNVVLGVFNLVPIPPLDGSRLLSIVLPQRHQGIVYFLDRYGIFLLLALLLFAPGLLTPFFDAITRFILQLVGLGGLIG